VTPQSNGILER